MKRQHQCCNQDNVCNDMTDVQNIYSPQTRLQAAIKLDKELSSLNGTRNPAVNVAVVTCTDDRANISDKISISHSTCTHVNCRIVVVDAMDMDDLSSVIQSCDIAIVVLSDRFVSANLAFQVLIFILRSIRKPTRYFNFMPSYMALVGSLEYSQSSISLLVGNAMIYPSFDTLILEWAGKFKSTASHLTSDLGPLPPTPDTNYFLCYTESDEKAVQEVASAMTDYQFQMLSAASDVPSAGGESSAVALVFVSHAFATDKKARETLGALLQHRVPIVVVVISDRSGKSWMQTGLGIVLSNELWVDFSVAPFYKPGEIVPSFEKRLRELSVRLRNARMVGGQSTSTSNTVSNTVATTVPTSAAKQEKSSQPSRIFISHSWIESDLDEQSFGPGGLAAFADRLWSTEHAPVRYACALAQQFHIDVDANILPDTRDYFQVTAERLFLADTAVLFWSASYVTSFFCYNEAFQSLVWQHKRVIIVFLQDFDDIIAALRSMPQHDRILGHVLALRLGESSDGAPASDRNLCGVSVAGKTHEQVLSELRSLLTNPPALYTPPPVSADILSSAHGEGNADSPQSSGHDVLVSYCWSNSATAFHRGHVSSVEGRTDPIAMKAEIERATGLRCWLDVEQLGSGGLFQGIHAALSSKSLKCVILCVSDEYARSPNCMMELEYAIRRIPCLVVSVGNGYAWRVKLAGYFVAYQESFDFVSQPFPCSPDGVVLFDALVRRVREVCSVGQQVTTTALR